MAVQARSFPQMMPAELHRNLSTAVGNRIRSDIEKQPEAQRSADTHGTLGGGGEGGEGAKAAPALSGAYGPAWVIIYISNLVIVPLIGSRDGQPRSGHICFVTFINLYFEQLN